MIFPCPFAIKIQNKCCGDTGGDSWNGTSWQQRDGQINSVPDSCCKTPSEGCGIRTHPSNINNKVELIGNYVTGQIIMSVSWSLKTELLSLGCIRIKHFKALGMFFFVLRH